MIRFIAAGLLLTAALQAQDRIPVLVELFTSEGCSSCPPADDLLAELERKQPVEGVDLIVLSEHVDYWNSLGWKDPYSAPAFSERQQLYSEMLRSNDVYTPQAVIDGHYEAVGSNRHNLLKAITESGESRKAQLQLTVTRQGDSLLVETASAEKGDVWVAIAEKRVVSRVTHGENSGRTLQHVGTVRSLIKVTGNQAHIDINKTWQRDLRVVAFVQDGHSGKILQAVQKTI